MTVTTILLLLSSAVTRRQHRGSPPPLFNSLNLSSSPSPPFLSISSIHSSLARCACVTFSLHADGERSLVAANLSADILDILNEVDKERIRGRYVGDPLRWTEVVDANGRDYFGLETLLQ